MHTLTIKLKQHTPVLNFQPNAASPIRATEIKPKLDKFIIANFNGIVPEEWFVKTDNKVSSLNYKMRILCESMDKVHCQTDKYGNPIIPMFFGNGKTAVMACNTDQTDNSVKMENTLEIELFCLNQSLLEYLEKKIDWHHFLLVNNFGTRQDKGYGSFFDEGKPLNTKNICGTTIKISPDVSYRVDSFFTLRSGNNDWNVVMSHINDVYKCLRGGINENGLYFKSLMFSFARYAKNKHKDEALYWDKRMIKELFYPKIAQDQFYGNKEKDVAIREWTKGKVGLKSHKDSDLLKPEMITQDPFLFRDFLGLSTNESWKIPYNKTIKKKSDSVARFKSPILFKPIYMDAQWYVFLLHREIPQKFKDALFTVSDTNIKKNGNVDTSAPYYSEYGNHTNSRAMRPYPNFFMSDYMNFVWQVRNYNNCFSIKNSNNDVLKRKERIVADLECLRLNYVTIDK